MNTFIALSLGVGMFAVVAAPILAGRAIERARHRDALRAVAEARTVVLDAVVLPFRYTRKAPSDGRTATLELGSAPSPAIVIVEPERPNLRVVPAPAWIGEETGAHSIVEEYAATLDYWSETKASEAERAFYADPLASWCLPPEFEVPDFLPEADGTFKLLAERGLLTGVGADIDTEWEAWNLYEQPAMV